MTNKIKMIASDTIHVTAVSSEPLQARTVFMVDTEDDAKRLDGYGHKRAPPAAPAPTPKRTRKRK